MTTAPSQRLVAELALALADLWAAELTVEMIQRMNRKAAELRAALSREPDNDRAAAQAVQVEGLPPAETDTEIPAQDGK